MKGPNEALPTIPKTLCTIEVTAGKLIGECCVIISLVDHICACCFPLFQTLPPTVLIP